ncbi:MAG: C40 family peptidase [Flavisolibacter sp.]
MSKTSLALLSGMILSLASCVYVIEDKNTIDISDKDSLQAKTYMDSLQADSVAKPARPADSETTHNAISGFFAGKEINTKNVQPQQLIDFARSQIGVPYKYGSIDPSHGFDCSGFITYVFNHFGILVPRSSIDFTEVGKPVPLETVKPGDIVLFTGTDSLEKFVGHMGLVVNRENDVVNFIHSTSGKAYGVTITPLSRYYMGRFIKAIRIFPQNG